MKNSLFLFILSSALLGVLSGCGEEKTPEVTTSVSSENIPSSSAPAAALSGEGVIQGKVLFAGTAPELSKIDMGADPVCSGAQTGPVMTEELVVNSNGTLRNAFVYIKEGLPAGAVYPVPSEPVTLDQKGCRYTPHVFGVRTNQTLSIVNSDPTLHNVHSQAKKSPEFNLGMPLQGMKISKSLKAQEVMAHFKCDVHPWMSAYAGVMDHPFFSVTGEDGSFEIKGVPAGKYTLEIWQEKLGTQTVVVDVPTSGKVTADVTYPG